jgi:formylglycine-generating enzyme required for sulfatase activity
MPVDSHPSGTSLFAVEDMAGNVLEWTNDWYYANYYQDSPIMNPSGPSSGWRRVLRGGSWYHDIRAAQSTRRFGFFPDTTGDYIGFRCAQSVE